MISVKTYSELTLKQQKFIDYYIQTGNGTKAAIEAGYSPKTAYSIASDNLKNLEPHIKERMKSLSNERIASAEEVLERLTRIARGEEKDAFGLDTNNQDKIKALELLGKNYQLYTDRVKQDNNLDINVTLDK